MPDLVSFIKNINGKAAISAYVGRKIHRYTETFLDEIGEKGLYILITQGINLADRIPEEKKLQLKMQALTYLNVISTLDPEIVYTWLPDKHRAFFESIPNGSDWAVDQLAQIKNYLIS